MPDILIEGIGKASFPDTMGREEIAEVIRRKFAPQIEALKEEQRREEFEIAQEKAQKEADEQGFVTSFLQGIGQAKDDFLLGKTLLDLQPYEAKDLLEKEYQKWKKTPQAEEASLLSSRGFGKALGEAGVTIVPTIGAGLGAGAVSTPLGGLITAGATASGIQATSSKGATFKNDYINLRHQQDMAGKPNLDAAFETARDTSNKAAMIAGGVAIASTAVPVGKLIPVGSSISGTVAKKVGAEIAFDSSLGAMESVASDVYAESQGVDRGDILENALRSAAAEGLIGGPFSAVRGRAYFKETYKQKADEFVKDRLAPPTQLALPAPPERLALPAPDSPAALLTGPSLTDPDTWQSSRSFPDVAEVPPMIVDGPIIDVKTGRLIDPLDAPNAPTALLDSRGNVIDFGDQNDAGRQAAKDVEIQIKNKLREEAFETDERIANKRTEQEDGKLGFQRTAKDFEDVKPRDPDVDAPTPKTERELTPTSKTKAPTTRSYQEGVEAIFKSDVAEQTTETTQAKETDSFREGYDEIFRKEETQKTEETTETRTEESTIPESESKISEGEQLLLDHKKIMNELGSRVGSGVDPIAAGKAVYSLYKMAAYWSKQNVKSAFEFAKRVGVKLTNGIREIWNDTIKGIVRTPSEFSKDIIDSVAKESEKTRKTESKKTFGQLVDEKIFAARAKFNLQDPDSNANKAIRKLVDRFVDLKMLQDAIAAGKKIPDTMNAYLRMEHLQDRVGFLKKELDETELEPFLSEMQRLGISNEDLHDYLHARHAPEANKRYADINEAMPDGGSGMTNKKAREVLAKFETDGKTKNLQQLEVRIRKLLQSQIDMELEGGLIDKANHERLSTFYKNYVPLNREGTRSDHLESGNRVFRGHRKRKGSDKKVVDILSNIFHQHYNTIEQVERNRVMASLEQLVTKFKNNVVAPAKPKMRPQFNNEGQVVSQVDPRWKDDPELVSYFIAGQERYLRVTNPHLARNLNNVGFGSLNKLVQWMGAGNRFLALINTQLAPSFVIPNFLRDLQTAQINLTASDAEGLRQNVLKGIRPAFKAAWKAEVGAKGKKAYEGEYGEYYKEFTEIGGKIEFFGLNEVKKIKGKINSTLSKNKTVNALKFLREKAGDINASVENTMRLSVYANARKAGMTKLQASSLAKNITVNFSRKGEMSSALNSWFLFFNAGVQGTYRMAQALENKKVRKATAGIAAFAVAQDFVNNIISDEDEDGESFYKKIPEHVRERNMIVMSPFDGEEYLTIPMPYGFNVFHYAGTNLSRMLRGEISSWDTLSHTTSSTLNAFNPIGGASDLFSGPGILRAATPDVLDPFTAVVTNKDWKDAPIRPDENPYDRYKKPDSQSYFGNVSEISKTVASTLNSLTGGTEVKAGLVDVSPETFDYVMNHLFGSMGKDALRPFTQDGAKSIPVLNRFVGGQTIYYDQENYYKLRGEAYQADDQIKQYRINGEVKKLQNYVKEALPLRRILPRIKETDKRIKTLTQRMKVIEASSKLSEDEKEIRLEALKEAKIKLMKLTRKRFLMLSENE
tara:strand:+ start:5078 stop:9676 length:4599 start_codon:yes stop_codon:yes gene_type:complete